MRSHVSAIREALLGIGGVGSVTRGQPRQDARLPCVEIAQESVSEARAFDDQAYLERSAYRLRVFGTDADALDALCEQIDAAMAGLGFRLAFAGDGDADGAVRMKALRYRIED